MLKTTWNSDQVSVISSLLNAAQRNAGGCEQEICKSLGILKEIRGRSSRILRQQEETLQMLGERLSAKTAELQRLDSHLHKADVMMCETERRLCRSSEDGGRNTLKGKSGIAGIIRLLNAGQTEVVQTAEAYRSTFSLSNAPFPACPPVHVSSPVPIRRLMGEPPLVTSAWLAELLEVQRR